MIQLIWKCPQLATRVNCLMALAKTHQLFDTPTILETILPCLEQLAEKDKTPAILMCVLGCFQALGQHLGVEYQAKSLLPAICKMLWEPALNRRQFEMVVQRTRDMIQNISVVRQQQLAVSSAVSDASNTVRSMT